MNRNYASYALLIAMLNLNSCTAQEPELSPTPQQSTVPQPVRTTQEQTRISYGSVVDFEQLVKQHGSESAALQKVLEADMAVLDFYATWCPPCKQLAPNFALAAEQIPNVLFVKINAEQFNSITKQYYIRSFPTLLFFHKGEKINSLSGFRNHKALVDEVSKTFTL